MIFQTHEMKFWQRFRTNIAENLTFFGSKYEEKNVLKISQQNFARKIPQMYYLKFGFHWKMELLSWKIV